MLGYPDSWTVAECWLCRNAMTCCDILRWVACRHDRELILPSYNRKNKTSSMAFRMQANYTDWVIAAVRRILVPTFADRGVSHGQRSGTPTAVNLSFLDRSRYFLFQVAPHLSSRRSVDPFQDQLLPRKPGNAVNRTLYYWDCSQEHWPLGHRGDHLTQFHSINRPLLTNRQNTLFLTQNWLFNPYKNHYFVAAESELKHCSME
jgi:hypothetical protein